VDTKSQSAIAVVGLAQLGLETAAAAAVGFADVDAIGARRLIALRRRWWA